jgi:hypothetical protein
MDMGLPLEPVLWDKLKVYRGSRHTQSWEAGSAVRWEVFKDKTQPAEGSTTIAGAFARRGRSKNVKTVQ